MRLTDQVRFVAAGALLVAACHRAPSPPCRGCVERPGCSMRPIRDDDPKIVDPLHDLLGCGPVVVYMNGFVHGVHGGYGSFCPDSPDRRKLLRDNQKRGFLPGHCETCLGVPDGQVFVLWQETEGPSCPDGCPSGDHAPLF